jgi:hypothetical protein
MIGGILVFMDDDSMDDWDRLFVRLGTLRMVGGVAAMRIELNKLTPAIMDVLSEAALNTVVHTGVNSSEQAAAFEIAALIDEIKHKQKEQDNG